MSARADAKGMGGHQSASMLKDEWLTPPDLLAKLGKFDLDPCAMATRPWPTADRHISLPDDGLALPWGNNRCFVNPPYGRETGRWLAKCADHGNATALVFARTETADWIKWVWGRAHSVLFIYGRLYFHHANGTRAAANSGAPSALVSYDAQNTAALDASDIPGRLVYL